ncbi:DNA polymerase III subunit beta [Consotaella salsifontis]|uniref:Beta sliding clamp n=1 Tax=Consotaella salsifontis TaxID=1365950 RepID=A0A1T4RWN9_9HYPH|nr:DNA polymerase III subunit beta [Consotaella salsifontis]SKA20158.1 DNA polymerase-3 subunit beta [Consotaella salsifontis]
MRIEIERTEFMRLLTSNSLVVQSRNTIPILATVLLNATFQGLEIRSTDLNVEIKNSIALECEPGAVCVSAKTLTDAVRKVSSETITLELKDSQLILKSGRSRYKLPTFPAEDFPDIADQQFDAEFEIDLAALIAPVAFAVSTDSTRFYLNGVLLHHDEGKIVTVGTDGHRLARNAIAAGEIAPGVLSAGIIVPRETLKLIPKGRITVAVSESRIRLTSGSTIITSRLVDGTYPDFKRVIPRNNESVATVDRDDLVAAVDRVSVVSKQQGSGIKLAFASDECALSSHGDGDAEDAIAIAFSGSEIGIGFSSRYLSEMLAAAPEGPVQIALDDGGAPALFTSQADPEWLGVLMPMRV